MKQIVVRSQLIQQKMRLAVQHVSTTMMLVMARMKSRWELSGWKHATELWRYRCWRNHL